MKFPRREAFGVRVPWLPRLPLIIQNSGCILKVCAMQPYAVAAVVDEWVATGRVLVKNTHELEGYRWPLDTKSQLNMPALQNISVR